MAENCPKLKLKRKKSFAEPELSSTSQQQSFRAASVSGLPDTDTGSVPPAAAWWTRDLPEPDRLWALIMRSALLDLQDHSGLVPDLPPPSVPRPTPSFAPEEHGLDLEEVPPFPEPSLSVQNYPDPLKDALVHAQRTPDPQDSPLSSHCSGPQSSHTSGTREWRTETRADDHSSQKDTAEREAGGLLPSCPMCLLAFPLGFTQMERDSHLAQCLSDMNIDMTWWAGGTLAEGQMLSCSWGLILQDLDSTDSETLCPLHERVLRLHTQYSTEALTLHFRIMKSHFHLIFDLGWQYTHLYDEQILH